MVDFQINDQGSIVGFTPLTEAAQAFLDDNVEYEPWQIMGNTLWVDHRYADDLRDGIVADGLMVDA